MTGFKNPTNDDGHYHGPDRHRRPSPELSYETLAQINPALVIDAACERTGIHRSHFEQALTAPVTPDGFKAYVEGTDK